MLRTAEALLTLSFSVPVYDGRNRFFWSKYAELPPLPECDAEKGTVCAVLFTLNYYAAPQKSTLVKTVLRKCAGLNLQAVVLLDDKNPHASGSLTIGGHDIPLGAHVEPDVTATISRAIVPNAVVHAPVAVHNENEVMV